MSHDDTKRPSRPQERFVTGRDSASADGGSVTPYKIRKGADRFRRRWQAEDESGQHRFARRAYTPDGAVRLMARDVAVYERTGRKSLHQRRRLWWVLTRCRIGWHKWHDGLRRDRPFCLSCGIDQPNPKRNSACRDCGNPVQIADECRVSGLCLFCLNGPVPS